MRTFLRLPAIFLLTTVLVGCGTVRVDKTPPKNPESLCSIFSEKPTWKAAAKKASGRWNTHVPTMMAIMYQESSFKYDARPMKKSFFGLVETPRSSAYGFSQALNSTWEDYMQRTGNRNGVRDAFEDSVDFMGWYMNATQVRNKVSLTDGYNHYLAYHEGWGGHRSGTFKKKPWLVQVAKKVDQRAKAYTREYAKCK